MPGVLNTTNTRLKPDFGLDDSLFPPLPEIQDKRIEKQVFTHRSLHARPTAIFEDHLEDLSPDNEKFEHLGDTVLGLTVTNLMFDLFPGLRVGPSTKIRALVVGNATLAEISLKYRLPDRLLFHPAQAVTLRASSNIQADVFESFVGGLYIDQGLDAIKEWLYVLFRPYTSAAYLLVRQQHGLPPSLPIGVVTPDPPSPTMLLPRSKMDAFTSTATVGHLALFNQYLQRSNRQVEWIYGNPYGNNQTNTYFSGIHGNGDIPQEILVQGTKTTPVWFVKVLVDGEFYGHGRGNTKKAARNEAAKQGLEKMGYHHLW
ncbi:ribonuclease III [Pluteus cervinus]|uniref:Ribonuclease III n=1 Tax=Pluteus cervinus TaxID=181527 RepID=A0ACD3A8J8_9AGAR|nr:ribonuclease III [Pluteus cervinus]